MGGMGRLGGFFVCSWDLPSLFVAQTTAWGILAASTAAARCCSRDVEAEADMVFVLFCFVYFFFDGLVYCRVVVEVGAGFMGSYMYLGS